MDTNYRGLSCGIRVLHWRNRASRTTPEERAGIMDQWSKMPERWLGRTNRRVVRCYRCQGRTAKGEARQFGVTGWGSFGFLCVRCRKGLTLFVPPSKE